MYDSNNFMQYIYVREILDFSDMEDRKTYEKQGMSADARSPETLLNLINGQFFKIFRCLNEKPTELSCPKERSRC